MVKIWDRRNISNTRWRYWDRRWCSWYINNSYPYVIVCSYSAIYNYWILPYKLFNIGWIGRQCGIIHDDEANIALGSWKIWLHGYFQDTPSQLHHWQTKSASSATSSLRTYFVYSLHIHQVSKAMGLDRGYREMRAGCLPPPWEMRTPFLPMIGSWGSSCSGGATRHSEKEGLV